MKTFQRWKGRAVIHLDLDAFYPAVEALDNPALRGKPVVVGGRGERGVVSSASYEARRFGVHSAQPVRTARRLCPQAVFLPVRMGRYREISQAVFDIFHRFTPLVEPLSIDEAFLDVTHSGRLFGDPVDTAEAIRARVREEVGLTVSAGVAPSKFVAKIASDIRKPDGLAVVTPESVQSFLDPLPVDRMWGVGKMTRRALAGLGIHTFRDLRLFPSSVLGDRFGRTGTAMQALAGGIDNRPVLTKREVKSVGREETFDRDLVSLESALKELLGLSYEVARRLRSKGLRGRTVTLKVTYADFRRISRSQTLPEDVDDGSDIFRCVRGLIEKTGVGRSPVRLLGVNVSQLGRGAVSSQMDFLGGRPDPGKRRQLNSALDCIHARFGPGGIAPGTLLVKDE